MSQGLQQKERIGVPGNAEKEIPQMDDHRRSGMMVLRSHGVAMTARRNIVAKIPAGEESMSEYMVNLSEILIRKLTTRRDESQEDTTGAMWPSG